MKDLLQEDDQYGVQQLGMSGVATQPSTNQFEQDEEVRRANALSKAGKVGASIVRRDSRYVKISQAGQEEEKEEEEVCGVCWDTFEVPAVNQDTAPIRLINCQHKYHVICIRGSCEESIRQGKFPIICPDPECNAKVR